MGAPLQQLHSKKGVGLFSGDYGTCLQVSMRFSYLVLTNQISVFLVAILHEETGWPAAVPTWESVHVVEI